MNNFTDFQDPMNSAGHPYDYSNADDMLHAAQFGDSSTFLPHVAPLPEQVHDLILRYRRHPHFINLTDRLRRADQERQTAIHGLRYQPNWQSQQDRPFDLSQRAGAQASPNPEHTGTTDVPPVGKPTSQDNRNRYRHPSPDQVDRAPGEKPEQPSMYPRPGAAGIVALLATLANNQFRPDDDPYAAFMGAYQGAKNDKYQRDLAAWQANSDRTKNDSDNELGDAQNSPDQNQTAPEDEPSTTQDKQATADQHPLDTDSSSAKNAAIKSLPDGLQPHAPHIPLGIKRSAAFLKMADDQEQQWNESGLDGPPIYDWQQGDEKGLSPVQNELGHAIVRSEMLHRMIDAVRANPTPGQQKAHQELEQHLAANQGIVNRLFKKNPASPSEEEKQNILRRARHAIDHDADPHAVHKRTRGLLLGLKHADSRDGYFDQLTPTYKRTPNGTAYNVLPFDR